ncbi:MAG TPA: DUF4340 domain-containing protein, partial [Limnochordia bacterium]|nr:DUF4340 domain-containing protein [Limnochordia bacterium]
ARLLVPYDGNAAEFGLDHPVETLTFVVGRGAEAHTEQFTVGHVATTAGEGWFVRSGDAPYLFVLDKPAAAGWRIDAATLLKKELLTVYPAETAGLEVDPPGQPHVSLSRQGGEWRSGTNPLGADLVENWLGALRELKAAARTGSNPAVLADPLWRIVWRPAANNLTKSDGPITLRIARTGSGYVAAVSDRPGVYALDAASVQALAQRWQDVMGAGADRGAGR